MMRSIAVRLSRLAGSVCGPEPACRTSKVHVGITFEYGATPTSSSKLTTPRGLVGGVAISVSSWQKAAARGDSGRLLDVMICTCKSIRGWNVLYTTLGKLFSSVMKESTIATPSPEETRAHATTD